MELLLDLLIDLPLNVVV